MLTATNSWSMYVPSVNLTLCRLFFRSSSRSCRMTSQSLLHVVSCANCACCCVKLIFWWCFVICWQWFLYVGHFASICVVRVASCLRASKHQCSARLLCVAVSRRNVCKISMCCVVFRCKDAKKLIWCWQFSVNRLPGCIRLRNNLYCVEWGVKLYSLTLLTDWK